MNLFSLFLGPNYGEEEEEGGGAKRLTLHGLLFGQRLLKKADAPPMPIAPAAPAAPSPDEAKDQNLEITRSSWKGIWQDRGGFIYTEEGGKAVIYIKSNFS